MQIQTTPLDHSHPPNVQDIIEPSEGYEAYLVAQSSNGLNAILGEALDNADQTLKVIRAVASDGELLCSNF